MLRAPEISVEVCLLSGRSCLVAISPSDNVMLLLQRSGRSWTSTLAPWHLEIWVMKSQPLFLQENLGGKWKVFDLYTMKNGSEGELMKKS